MENLPIDHILPELLRTVQAHPNTVLSTPRPAPKNHPRSPGAPLHHPA